MNERTTCKRLQVATQLFQFVEREALPGTGVAADAFWAGFDALVHDLAPRNRELLAERDRLQAELDNWYRQNPGAIKDPAAYREFLASLGYLKPVPGQVAVKTDRVDTEISQQAGPQLVVPITNARYALNAANATAQVPASARRAPPPMRSPAMRCRLRWPTAAQPAWPRPRCLWATAATPPRPRRWCSCTMACTSKC